MFKVCLFSPVKGKVILNGQPVAGAVIERTYDWAWKNQKGGDSTTTDLNGEFSLPAIHATMILGNLLPHEPVIEQDIYIKHQGKTYEAWHHNKHNYSENGELGGVCLELSCELSIEPQKKTYQHYRYFGISEIPQR